MTDFEPRTPPHSKFVRWFEEDRFMKEHGIIYDSEEEEWNRTVEETEDERVEREIDEIDRKRDLEKIHTAVQLSFLRQLLKDIKNKQDVVKKDKPPLNSV